MYDIDRFFNEKISLNFDTIEEAKIFSAECKARRIIHYDIFVHYGIDKSYVCNWDDGEKNIDRNIILFGTDEFHVAYGWKSMRASELKVENIILSKTELMEFLEV